MVIENLGGIKRADTSTEKKYPIPNIDNMLDRIGKCRYLTTLDLASEFHQIEMDSSDFSKTAFIVANRHYEFLHMLFGLKNASSLFQKVMHNVLRGIENCSVYLDDIIVYSTS